MELPAGTAIHDDKPVDGPYVPLVQATHAAAEDPPVLALAVPLLQEVHAVACPVENVPTAQVVMPVAPKATMLVA